jgi:hypothetical protein
VSIRESTRFFRLEQAEVLDARFTVCAVGSQVAASAMALSPHATRHDAYNEALLAAQYGPNVATIPDPVAGNVDTNGYFTWTGVINFDTNPSANDGYFNGPDDPDDNYPGIPGNTVNGLLYYQTSGSAQLEWIMQNPDGTRSLVNDTTNSITAYYQLTTPVTTTPTLSVARTANGITLAFTGTIQAADTVLGPWTDLAGASPMAVTTTDPRKFYRAKQ